jgi:excisionase family DNA binding protein
MSRKENRKQRRAREHAERLTAQGLNPEIAALADQWRLPPILPEAQPAPRRTPPHKNDTPPVLCTVREIADALKVSRATVDRLHARGQLPGKVMIGGQVRYIRQIVDEWLLRKSKERQDGNKAERTGNNHNG